MDQPAGIFVTARIERRKLGRADLVPRIVRVYPDVREHHPAAFVHRRMQPVRRLQRAERHRQIESVERVERRPGIGLDPARKVASDGSNGLMRELGKQQAHRIVETALEPGSK